MFCSRCKDDLLVYFEDYIVENMPTKSQIFNDIFKRNIEVGNDSIGCFLCRYTMIEGETYIKDVERFHYDIFEFIGKQIMKHINSCEECGEGANIQNLYPSIKSCFYDKDDDPQAIFDDLNTSSTLEDIMNNIFSERADLWDPYYDEIAKHVECPHCENGSGENYDEKIDHGIFGRHSEVYTQNDIDRFNHDFYRDEIEEVYVEINEIAKNMSLEELVNLKNEYLKNKTFIAKNEMFAKNETFAKLEKFLKDRLMKKEYYVLARNRIIYRTRVHKIGSILSKEELWEPPYVCSSHGRFNGIGESVLYCANNVDVIKKEVSLQENCLYNIAKFIIHKPLKMFPINYIFKGSYSGLMNERVPENSQNIEFKEQYILSNIVSAICLQIGYDGIVYKSTKDNYSIDYAIFNTYEKGKDLDIIDIVVED